MMSRASAQAPLLPVAALLRLYATQWWRSRAPLGLLAFVAVFCWFDAATLRGNAGPWWTIMVFLASWTGFLTSYDTYERLRSDGSLRLVLVHPVPRRTIALSLAAAGWILSVGAVLVCAIYLLISGRVSSPVDLLRALPLVLLGIGGWVAFAQALSLVLPRDTAAVLGVIALIFGAFPYDRWLPAGAPELLHRVVLAIWYSIPSSLRLSETLAGTGVSLNAALMAAHVLVGLGLTWALLSRRSLLARPADRS